MRVRVEGSGGPIVVLLGLRRRALAGVTHEVVDKALAVVDLVEVWARVVEAAKGFERELVLQESLDYFRRVFARGISGQRSDACAEVNLSAVDVDAVFW